MRDTKKNYLCLFALKTRESSIDRARTVIIKFNFNKAFEVNLELFMLGMLSLPDASLGTTLGISFFKISCAFSYLAASLSTDLF